MLFRYVSVSLGLAALAVVSNCLVAQADVVDLASVDVFREQPVVEEAIETQPELAIAPVQPELTESAEPLTPLAADSEVLLTPLVVEETAGEEAVQLAEVQELSTLTATPEVEQAEGVQPESVERVSDASTVMTSADGLANHPATGETEEASAEPVGEQQVAQTVTPGRSTRSGPSYIGIGGNIGLGDGDTALGDGSFAVFSKIGLTSFLSVRPTVLFSDDPTILIPVTFDFIPGVTDVTEDVSGDLGLRISPYIGGGVAISTGDSDGVDFLLSGGVDVPLTSRFTATAAVNATLFDNTAVGLLLGVGYNFSAF